MKIRLIIYTLLTFLTLNARSQNQIQKASKTMEYSFVDCSELAVLGEKATIRITGKVQNSVELKITLISKHKNQAVAINDLRYVRFSSQKLDSKLILKNYYESANKKIESNLSVMYEIFVPETMIIQLQNLYGSVYLYNLKGSKSINISFGRIDMQQITGVSNFQLKYCNLTAVNIGGKITGTLSKSDANIENCTANTELSTNYGNISASIENSCDLFKISGNRTSVDIYLNTLNHNLDLQTTHNIVQTYHKTVNQKYQFSTKNTTRNVIIRTSYCPIKINLK